jgi:hypothetical protein
MVGKYRMTPQVPADCGLFFKLPCVLPVPNWAPLNGFGPAVVNGAPVYAAAHRPYLMYAPA